MGTNGRDDGVVATFMGGCTGSTAGGIKAYRLAVIYNLVVATPRRLLYPNAVVTVRYGATAIDAEVQRGVFIFLVLFLFFWSFGSIALSALGYDVLTATSAALTALSNVGPGLGPIIGPAGNFSTLTEPALYVLSMPMLLGRLEILTVLMLAAPVFWRY